MKGSEVKKTLWFVGLSAWLLFWWVESPPLFSQMEFAIIGDAGARTEGSKLVRESIHNQKVNQLILPGDNLYHLTYKEVWDPWISIGMQFAMVAIGNHTTGYEAEKKFFAMPEEFYTKRFD